MAARALTSTDVQYLRGVMAPSIIVEQYPAFAALVAIPEVRDLLTEGANHGWTSDAFLGHLMGTQWWKSNSDTQRKWTALELADPSEANRQRFSKDLNIVEQSSMLGMSLSHAQIADLGNQAMSQGWDDATLRMNMMNYADPGHTKPGLLEATQGTLRGIAASQGMNVADATTWDWAKKINSGMADQQGFAQWAQDQAAISHPYWEKQIKQGVTVRQLADPYIQQASQLLETSPDQINLADHKWDFTTQNKAGDRTPMSQSDWATHLMTDGRYGWDRTQNAKESAFQVVDNLRQSFGAK